MYIIPQQKEEIQNWINCLKQEMNKVDIMLIKSYYEEYKTIKGILKNSVQFFSKLGLLAEFYELFTVFQNDKKIGFTMFFDYQLLPVVINDQLHQPLISEYFITEEEQNLLIELGSKIQFVFAEEKKENLLASNILNFENKLTRMAYCDNDNRKLVELDYKIIYDFFCKYLEIFEQRKYFQLYGYFKSLTQSKINLKNYCKYEKTLAKIILNQDLISLTEKQVNQFIQLNYFPKFKEFAANYKEKVQKIQCLKFQQKSLEDFINYKLELAQIVYPCKPYNIEQFEKSDDLKYSIKTFGDDFKINLILTSLPDNETIQEMEFDNRGLFEISFSETIQYFYILQSFSIEIYQIKPFKNILTFIVDLDYMEERFVRAKFYCNDQKLILISDLQIFLKTFHEGRFVLERNISLVQMSKVSMLKIIQSNNFQNCQIEVFSKTNANQILYCLIQANTGGLIKYYRI